MLKKLLESDAEQPMADYLGGMSENRQTAQRFKRSRSRGGRMRR
jgi:hypothetical protein